MSHPPRKPSRRPKAPPPDPDLEVNDGRTHVFQGPRREDHLSPPSGLPRLPPPPRPRDLTPLSPIPGPPSSAVGVPSSGLPVPVPQPPRAWRYPDGGYPPEEAKTPASSAVRRMYDALIASFDHLSDAHRLVLVDMCSRFAAVEEPGARERLYDIVELYAAMGEPDRTRLIRLARALPEREVEIDVAVVE